MPEKNRTYRARIEGYTSEGLGVARIDGQAVFVHRALRGEDCDVLILKVLKNAAFGKVVEGMEAVDRIAAARTNYNDKPRINQTMKKVTVETFGVDYPDPVTR